MVHPIGSGAVGSKMGRACLQLKSRRGGATSRNDLVDHAIHALQACTARILHLSILITHHRKPLDPPFFLRKHPPFPASPGDHVEANTSWQLEANRVSSLSPSKVLESSNTSVCRPHITPPTIISSDTLSTQRESHDLLTISRPLLTLNSAFVDGRCRR